MLADGLELRSASIANHTTGTLVAAVTGRRIVVHALSLSLDSAGEIQLLSASTAMTGLIELGDSVPLSIALASGFMQTVAGEALNMTATAAANGFITYSVQG